MNPMLAMAMLAPADTVASDSRQRAQVGQLMFVRDDIADMIEQATSRNATEDLHVARGTELASIEWSLANGSRAWQRVRGAR